MNLRRRYSHTRAMARHNGYRCSVCNGDGMIWEDIYGEWEILRTLEYECEACSGTGWDLSELTRNFKAVRRHTIQVHRHELAA